MDLNASTCTACIFAWFSRILLLITVTSLLTAPLTQHIWTWDHFLRGGQDFESGSLVALTVLCLMFLLAQSCRQKIVDLFAACQSFSRICNNRISAGIARSRKIAPCQCKKIYGPVLAVYNLSLQI
jgi:hypothetical protein